MAKPVMRLSISNKDKSERTFKDYKGNDRAARYQGVGAIFKNEDGRLSVAVDRKFTVDPDKHWLNIFVNDSDDEKPATKKSSGSKPGKKYTKKAAPTPSDDEDETEADDDGEDPFAD